MISVNRKTISIQKSNNRKMIFIKNERNKISYDHFWIIRLSFHIFIGDL